MEEAETCFMGLNTITTKNQIIKIVSDNYVTLRVSFLHPSQLQMNKMHICLKIYHCRERICTKSTLAFSMSHQIGNKFAFKNKHLTGKF